MTLLGREHGHAGASLDRVGHALRARGNPAAAHWFAGAQGERLTALLLRPLLLSGAHLLYNRQLPGQRTDVDAVALTPWGNYVVDSKKRDPRVTLSQHGGVLEIDGVPWDLSSSMREAMTVRAYLGAPVIPLVVLWGPRLPPGGLRPWTRYGGRIAVLSWRDLWPLILRSQRMQDRAQVARLSARLQRHLPAYGEADRPTFWSAR